MIPTTSTEKRKKIRIIRDPKVREKKNRLDYMWLLLWGNTASRYENRRTLGCRHFGAYWPFYNIVPYSVSLILLYKCVLCIYFTWFLFFNECSEGFSKSWLLSTLYSIHTINIKPSKINTTFLIFKYCRHILLIKITLCTKIIRDPWFFWKLQ